MDDILYSVEINDEGQSFLPEKMDYREIFPDENLAEKLKGIRSVMEKGDIDSSMADPVEETAQLKRTVDALEEQNKRQKIEQILLEEISPEEKLEKIRQVASTKEYVNLLAELSAASAKEALQKDPTVANPDAVAATVKEYYTGQAYVKEKRRIVGEIIKEASPSLLQNPPLLHPCARA